MKLPVLFIFSVLLLISSCADAYRINGVSNESFYDGSWVYLKQQTADGWVVVDSCNIVHGKFGMNGNLEKEVVSILVMDDLEAPIIPIVLEAGDISINVGRGSITVSGGRLNDTLSGFMNRIDSFVNVIRTYEHRASAMILDGYGADLAEGAIRDSISKVSKTMDGYIEKFVRNNYNTALGPFAFRWLCPLQPRMTQQIERVLADAPQVFKEDSFVKEFVYMAGGSH